MSKVEIGDNRTGVGFASSRAAAMTSGTAEFSPTSHDTGAAAALRAAYVGRDRVGSVPSVGPMGKPMDRELAPVVDKLGARLAFERAAVRLYEGLIAKFDTSGSFDGGPGRADLERICSQEHEHFSLVWGCILSLGADPTAMTPSADLQLTAGKGIGDVIGDPRTTLLECLEAIMVAELVDEVSWEGVIELIENEGVDLEIDELQHALDQEREHVEMVRGWVAAGHGLAPTRH